MSSPAGGRTAPLDDLAFDLGLVSRYDVSGPRYTSYPTAVQFSDGFTAADYQDRASASNSAPASPLSLYAHLPFCATVCFYCACTKVITANRKRAEPYLERVHREIERQGALFDRSRPVNQLHWGGGTPTFLSAAQMGELMGAMARHFSLRDDDGGEYSIEIDPREAGPETVALLRSLGFNRMSLGIQDFDPRVQRAVNRLQSAAQTWAVLDAARARGFRSVSVDLIYGLPLQTPRSFARTLDEVISARPDRLSVFNYAHLPRLFKTQRQIDEAQLPTPADKLALLQLTIERLGAAGYVYIGMDHFALPGDELARARENGTLHRNFQGYSTHGGCDLVAVGMSAIGSVAGCYSQNQRTLEDYCAAIDAGGLAVARGVALERDDRIRRDLITHLMCRLRLDKAAFGEQWGIDFERYFGAERDDLQRLAGDGLIENDADVLAVAPAGRLLVRNVCMVFDRHLRESPNGVQFSRAI